MTTGDATTLNQGGIAQELLSVDTHPVFVEMLSTSSECEEETPLFDGMLSPH